MCAWLPEIKIKTLKERALERELNPLRRSKIAIKMS